MLTLCQLESPVRIRAPDSEALRQFKFFMSRSRAADGGERLQLHMGYFDSLADAQKWAHTLRARFPSASPERVPDRILGERGARAAAPVAAAAAVAATPASQNAPVLTDTQVLRVLETRHATPVTPSQEEQFRGISLVGPQDTQERRVLKDAVLQGASVSFAVQLFESAADIDFANVPALSIFRAYTLYKASVTREGRTVHCLRLGFFTDAISAKQVAYYVRSHFSGVGVVPVTESERTQGKASPIDPGKLSDDFQRSIDQALEATSPAKTSTTTTTLRAITPKRRADGLEQTLEMLAASEIWNDSESHSETGVRHLRLEVQKKKSPR